MSNVLESHAENGKLTKAETSHALYELRHSTKTGMKQQDRRLIDGRAIKASEADFRKTNLGLCEHLFEGRETILVEEIMHL